MIGAGYSSVSFRHHYLFSNCEFNQTMKLHKFVRNIFQTACLCVLCGSWLHAQTTILVTNNTTISGTNAAYDGQNIVVDASVLTINGTHAFNSLSLSNNATLTHQAASTLQTYSLILTITNGLVVDSTSSINVSGRGYPAGYTQGDTNAGGATSFAGGSYGGFGGIAGSEANNDVYGDYHNPSDPGSGAGPGDSGGAGGGLVQITVGSLQVDGAILANGGSSTAGGGGGSGGGVLLNAGSLSGAGMIEANGGGGSGSDGGGGGGGRVAIYYGTSTFNFSSNVTAVGGQTSAAGGSGSVGTVYLHPMGGPDQLIIDNHGAPTKGWTPLGAATDTAIQVDTLVVSGSNVIAAPEHQMAIVADSISIVDGGELTQLATTSAQVHSLLLTATNNLVIDEASSINVSGCGFPAGYTQGDTNAGGATSFAGGSYGGFGGISGSEANNNVYGDYHNPIDPGSGAGPGDSGGAGGGLVQITVGSLQVDGAILANGGSSSAGGGGGSGGSVLLNAGSVSGAGMIEANGGAGSGGQGGGGGGGRVAIYYGASTFNLSSDVTTLGGHTSANGGSGAVGTVYLQQTGGPGELIIDNHDAPTAQWTPLGAAADTTINVDMLFISGTNVVAAPQHQMSILANFVSITNGAELTQLPTTPSLTYSLVLTVTNDLIIDETSTINVSGCGYVPGYILGDTNAGGATIFAGGSYGGLGGIPGNEANNAVYGDYRDPSDLGSGSGTGDGGAAGGGLVQITAGSLLDDGQILANGGSNSRGGGGGSGGGVLLNVGNLSGFGTVEVNGGAGSGGQGGGGGGGRVAIYFGTNTLDLSSNVTAFGGFTTAQNGAGASGTVYLQQTGSPGQLVINNEAAPTTQWTPLGQTNDTVFIADNLVISGSGTVAATVSGAPIQAGSLSLVNGAILTHLPATAAQVYSLSLAVTNNLLVDSNSTINVTGRGYLAGRTLGNTNLGAASSYGGGSYGGLGGVAGGEADNAVYGDYHNPSDLGSGSGTGDVGAPGGGLVQITAGNAQIDGEILANGGSNGNGGGGGSGGGVLLKVGMFSGAGAIEANGGTGSGSDGGGGGGGRVAIYYGANTFDLSSNVTAFGGHTTAQNASGASGTVYLQQTGSPGQLVINNELATTTQWTPLGQTNDTVFIADNLVLSGSGTVAATVSGAPIQAGNLSLVNGAVLTHLPTTAAQVYSLLLTVTNNLLIDGNSSINVSARGYVPGRTVGNTNLGAATSYGGGSYGGLGGVVGGEADNAVYGDYHNPSDLGSGSGTGLNGASGGGLVQITAASAQIDGEILANGGSNGNGGGGGSGGGVLLNVESLSGAGTIEANGGTGSGSLGGGGGGGRVAIYYGANTFDLSSNVATIGGPTSATGGTGAVGTIYLHSSTGPDQLIIDSHGTVAGQWTPLGAATDTVVQMDILVISGTNVVVAPEHQMAIMADSVAITNGGEMTHQLTTSIQTYSLVLTATSNLLVDGTSSINVADRGYLPGHTLGNTNVGASTSYGGGSYGGLGGVAGGETANAVYGDYHDPADLGSGSATGEGGAPGGGLAQITAENAQIDGKILADGGSNSGGGGGGSGGGLLLNIGTLSGIGTITANGGTGSGTLGGGGGGGRVAIYTSRAMDLPTNNVTALGEHGGANGQNGSVYFATQPFLSFLNVPQAWHGVEEIAWSSLGVDPNDGVTSEVVVTKGGVTYLDEITSNTASTSLNTATVADGVYTLTLSLLSSSGLSLTQISQSELINNSLAWHEGTLSTNETWGTNSVNAVDETIIIPSGVTLTIAPGAIIKFAPGTGIIIEPGGVLDASGAMDGAPIVFTSLSDSSVGGDSKDDGGASLPQVGDWNGITALGQAKINANVQVRFVSQTVSGVLSGNQEWFSDGEYLVTGNITVPTNVTLTIDPGAVVKFGLGQNLTVNAGGTLIANGTIPQPIVFTSINDQSAGVNTNGISTIPAAGDWDSIYLKGGNATFDHVAIRYGGGPDSLNSGLISITAVGSVVSVSDSILSQGLYKGIQAEYGTVNVTNCLITGCDRGIQPGLNGPTTVNIINCTLDNNNVGLWAHGGVMNVANTIISDSVTTGVEFCCGSSLALFEHCDVWSATGINYSGVSDQTGAQGNISVNPKFVNANQGNYELGYSSPCIDAGDGTVAPLTDLAGAPRYNDPRTIAKTGVTNANGAYPDMGALEFVETAPSDVDLIATAVTGPLHVSAGETVTVQWNDVNIGTGTAVGPWHDTISLVPSSGGDLVVATVLVAQNTVLGPGQSYGASASVVVPGGQQGANRWQVQVNSQGDVFEGVNWTNNRALAASPTSLEDAALTVGGPSVTNNFTATGQFSVFAVASPGATFVVNVQGNPLNCALKVYVGAGYVPDTAHFDFQSGQFNSPTASVTVPDSGSNSYYVVVYATSLNSSPVSFILTATPLAFAVHGVSPAEIANSGAVTLQILGDELAGNDTYSLIGPGGNFTASSVQSTDPTVAYATFNLGGGASGHYSLTVAQPGGQTLTLSNATFVVSDTNIAAAGSLSFQLALPSAFRKGRNFDGTISYRNTGVVDIPAPILLVSAGGVAGITEQGSTNYLTSDLAFIGASFNGPAGILAPGDGSSLEFAAFYAQCGTLPFSVSYITPDATNLINYTALESSLQPPGYCTSSWSVIWTNFEAKAGPTWGGFATLLDSYSAQMALTDAPGEFYLVRDVLAYAFAQLAGGGCTNGLSLYPPATSLARINHGPSQNVSCVQSADPNVKFATGIGDSDWLASDDEITYTIDFANETNASAPAQTVTITDPLTTNLDWSTLQLTSISFNNVTIQIPHGVQSFSTSAAVDTDPNPVAVTAALNPTNGIVTWLMESINPVTSQLVTDPLAGFLPPDNVLGQGEGSVTFTIAPISGLATRTQINNQASIVFDVNAAISTPTTTNLLDVTPPTSSITPLPTNSPLTFSVAWSGQDAGSGIASFDIFVSTDDGPWLPWQLDTTNTSATYSGTASQSYAFYSVAYDEVGNVEASPIIPGASTVTSGTVVMPVPINISLSAPGSLTLTWSQGTLLQATKLAGPWTINTVASPYIVAPTNSQMYFKLLVN
jgi:hypothetical protein